MGIYPATCVTGILSALLDMWTLQIYTLVWLQSLLQSLDNCSLAHLTISLQFPRRIAL